MCEYGPFTRLLRYQALYPSKDFMEILYHALNYVLVDENKKLKVTVSTVEATERLVNCISTFMIGGNEMNQNFIIDSKFPQIIVEVLKM